MTDLELRAYEATVANLEARIRDLEETLIRVDLSEAWRAAHALPSVYLLGGAEATCKNDLQDATQP